MSVSLLLALFVVAPLSAQEPSYGVSVPLTLSFGAMDTHRLQVVDPSKPSATYGFRAVASPTVMLGKHWFVYAALQERLNPYFYYDAYVTEHDFRADVLQAYVGYSIRKGRTAVVF